jgi:hypothetical protein
MAFRADFSFRCCRFIRASAAVVHVETPADRLEAAVPEPTDMDRSPGTAS